MSSDSRYEIKLVFIFFSLHYHKVLMKTHRKLKRCNTLLPFKMDTKNKIKIAYHEISNIIERDALR